MVQSGKGVLDVNQELKVLLKCQRKKVGCVCAIKKSGGGGGGGGDVGRRGSEVWMWTPRI